MLFLFAIFAAECFVFGLALLSMLLFFPEFWCCGHLACGEYDWSVCI